MGEGPGAANHVRRDAATGDPGDDATPNLPAASRVPSHVAIIMDGNGRWASRRGLARAEGHQRGTDNIRQITRAAAELGVRHLTLWAFSTENWRRPADEISAIMRILSETIAREGDELDRQGAQLRHIGSLEGLKPSLRDAVLAAIDRTRDNDRLVLTLAFNYGGRSELVAAVQQIVAAGIPADRIDEATIADHLFTAGLPDPDLVIRTSGEHRMSNFLLWQSAFAELYFTPVLWPDFGPDDLREAIAEFGRRERRFGGIAAELAHSVGA